MSASDKLFASRLSFGTILTIVLLLSYAIFTAYSNEIQNELTRVLVDSFGHLEGEIAKL